MTPGFSGLGRGDDASLGDEGISEGGLAVIDVGDDGHVADVVLLVHDRPDLVDREVHLPEGVVNFQVLHSRVGPRPYPQTLDKSGEACQGQTKGC